MTQLRQFSIEMPRIGARHRDSDRADEHAAEEARDELETIRRKNQEDGIAGADPGRSKEIGGPRRAPDDLLAIGRVHLRPVPIEERIERGDRGATSRRSTIVVRRLAFIRDSDEGWEWLARAASTAPGADEDHALLGTSS
jgi:hypothetical protein